VKLRLTMVCEYDVDPEHYGTHDPVEAARIDQVQIADDPTSGLALLVEAIDFDVKVEPA
jgi:hypothetical protein